ncbi:MAG: HAD family hydrolase [Terracidiphilus sp.]
MGNRELHGSQARLPHRRWLVLQVPIFGPEIQQFPPPIRYHTTMPQFPPGQTLLIDADDTLWENNVYFERAIAAFISYLNHYEYSPAEVRLALNEVERETILTHGYGLPSFTHSLLLCFERLSPAAFSEESRRQVESFARAIAEQEIELLPGVSETLAELATRHRLILMTKGNHAEQADKLTRSGLASYFSAVEIVAEKDPATYREVIQRYGSAPDTPCAQSYWMIGNSPKSDINPALAAGLNAVFLFHKDTWVLEHATLDLAPEGQQLMELDSFAKLRAIF